MIIGLIIRVVPPAGTSADSGIDSLEISDVSSSSSSNSSVVTAKFDGVLSITPTPNEFGVDSRSELSSLPEKLFILKSTSDFIGFFLLGLLIFFINLKVN